MAHATPSRGALLQTRDEAVGKAGGLLWRQECKQRLVRLGSQVITVVEKVYGVGSVPGRRECLDECHGSRSLIAGIHRERSLEQLLTLGVGGGANLRRGSG